LKALALEVKHSPLKEEHFKSFRAQGATNKQQQQNAALSSPETFVVFSQVEE